MCETGLGTGQSFGPSCLDELTAVPKQRGEDEYGNCVMTALLRILLLEVRPHLGRIRWSDNRRVEANESHARIHSALAAGDAEPAQSEMRDHIRTAYNRLLDEMRQPPTMNGGQVG